MIQKSTLVIAIALVSVAGIAVGNTWMKPRLIDHQYVVRTVADDMERTTTKLSADARGAKRLKVNLQYAEVIIDTTGGSDLSGDVVKEVNKPTDGEERAWLSNNWLQVKREGDVLVVYEVPSEKPKLNNGSKNHRNLNVKVTLHVPQGLDTDLDIDAGTVHMEGSYRSVKGHLDAGEITTQKFSSDGKVDFDLDAGSVEAKLDKVPRQDSNISVNVGDISLDMKGNATLDAKVGLGGIDVPGQSSDKDGLGSRQQIRVGNGGTKFSLRVDAGNISISHGKTEKKTVEKIDLPDGLDIDIDIDGQDFGKDIQKEVERAMREASKAMKDIRFDFDMKDEKVQKDVEMAIREAQKESEKAMKEAEKEMARAHLEMKNLKLDIEMAGSIREITREAMRAAKEAMALARQEMRKAFEKSRKNKGNESI